MQDTTLSALHPAIQCVVLRLANPALTFEKLGQDAGISRQAAEKRFKNGLAYLKAFTPHWDANANPAAEPSPESDKRDQLIGTLRRQLILANVQAQLARLFKAQVLKFFPKFRVTRLPAQEKKQILEHLAKFRRAGGLIKEFAQAVGKSAETLARWQEAYEKHGLAGLTDKTTRPRHFGHALPLRIRDQLVLLFLQFPNWTPYQYHSYIRHNPTTRWYVSLPVIQKLKTMHREASEQEKERIKKRWCFSPGTDVWTIDFTCLWKTEHVKLQCLTISDHRSRFLLHTSLHLDTSTERVMDVLEELFIRYGKPKLVKADNGPEFRLEFREDLRALAVYLLNSPEYYGQFCGAHERIHRTMKSFITRFESHGNLTRLVAEIGRFQDEYNYKIPMDALSGKTPAGIFFGDERATFVHAGAEPVSPYEKDGELRMKFTGRDGSPARMAVPVITPTVDVSETADSETSQ